MNAYTIVQGMADEGDTQCETLFDYHNKTVQKYIEITSLLQDQKTSGMPPAEWATKSASAKGLNSIKAR